MKKIKLGNTSLFVSPISLGCMRIAEMETAQVTELISRSLDCGIDFFDHADIYGGGQSEEIFAKAVKAGGFARDRMILQSKCGIRKGFFDFSKAHIIASAEQILLRLGTDYLDVLLLHRPDTLVEPDEVAEAFSLLEEQGKVRYFGVSNMNPMQIGLLKTAVRQPIVANQLQLSCAHTGMIDIGLNSNMKNAASADHDGSILEYCRIHGITIQSWSSLQYGFFEGVFLGSDKYPELNEVLDRIAREQNVTAAAVAIAWILRHPARMQAVVGTTKARRLAEMARAAEVELSREAWYEIYRAAGNVLP